MTYTECLMQCLVAIGEKLGKPAGELLPWDDYDPILVDEQAYCAANGKTTQFSGE